MPDTNPTPIQPTTSPLASEPDAAPDSLPILRLRAAFAEVEPEMAALPPEDVPTRINVDVAFSCVSILGCLPKIETHKAALLALQGFHAPSLEKLLTYTLATQHAQTRYQSATQPPASLPALLEQMTKVRERLLYDLTGVAAHGIIDASPLKELKGVPSNVDIGQHTLIMVNLARETFGEIAGKIPYTMDDLKKFEADADKLLNLLGLKYQGGPSVAKVLDDRNRALALLVRAFDEVRRGLTFLRWRQNDVENIAPSLYAGRGGKARKQDEPAPTPTPSPVPSPSPAPAPIGGNGVPLPTGPGMPGNDPFQPS